MSKVKKIPILIKDLGIQQSKTNRKIRVGEYKCQYCDSIFVAEHKKISKRIISSCGCQKKENKEYFISKLPLYGTWYMMHQRCNNPKNKYYEYYGGRGIKVCDRWLDINNFIEDMYPLIPRRLDLR